jgi:hypothetical protein
MLITLPKIYDSQLEYWLKIAGARIGNRYFFGRYNAIYI